MTHRATAKHCWRSVCFGVDMKNTKKIERYTLDEIKKIGIKVEGKVSSRFDIIKVPICSSTDYSLFSPGKPIAHIKFVALRKKIILRSRKVVYCVGWNA